MECCEIKFHYFAKIDGIFDVSIPIVINESHTFDISVSGEVVAQSLYIDQRLIIFDDPHEFRKQIELYNPFTSHTYFRWDIPLSCFEIVPITGHVPSKSRVICEISYHPERNEVKLVDMTLISNYFLNHVVKVIGCEILTKIDITPDVLEFNNVPLNVLVTKKISIRNKGTVPVTFEIKNSSPADGIEIAPISDILQPNNIAYVKVSVQLESIINFQFNILVDLNVTNQTSFFIIGNVVYPDIKIEPSLLAFRKIYEHAYDLLSFSIKNCSNADAKIDFGIQEYKEFKIFKSIDKPDYISSLKLKPDQSQMLYIEYIPLYVSTLSFLLPLVINDILGPPDVCFVQTQRNAYFLTPVSQQTSSIVVPPFPESLPIVKIVTSVRNQAITFSKFNMDFFYLPYGEITTEMLNVIHNPTTEYVEFILRTDDVVDPFSITYHSGERVEINDLSLSAILPPKTEVIFKIEFKPDVPGKYDCKIPVYVRNYLEDSAYNYLTCSGTYNSPTIVGSSKVVYFEAIFFHVHSEYEYVLTLSSHQSGCKLEFITDISELTASFIGGRENKGTSSVNTKHVTLCLLSNTTIDIDKVAKFQCSCGVYYEVIIKATCENCFLTNHAFVFTKFYSSVAEINFDLVSTSFTLTNTYGSIWIVFFLTIDCYPRWK